MISDTTVSMSGSTHCKEIRSHLSFALFLATVAGTFALSVGRQLPPYDVLLGLTKLEVTPWDRFLVGWIVWSMTFLCFVPMTVLAIGCIQVGRSRLGTAIWLAGSAGMASLLVLDVHMFSIFGLRVSDLLGFAGEPDAWGMTGDALPWVLLSLRVCVETIIVAGLGIGIAFYVARRLHHDSHWLLHARCRVAAVGLVIVLVLLPIELSNSASDARLMHRAWAALPFDIRVGDAAGRSQWTDHPSMRQIEAKVNEAFHQARPHLAYAPRSAFGEALPIEDKNVIVIVIESMRHEALAAGWMPRLAARADQGLHMTRHYAATNRSELGLYSLMYGRSALLYDLNGPDPNLPPILALAKASDLRTVYTTSHPIAWNGREQFMSDRTFDVVEGQERSEAEDDTFPRRDRRTMAALSRHLEDEQPMFALAFLISTHWGYAYPSEYEILQPVPTTLQWDPTTREKLSPSLRQPLMNHYRNALRFADDLVADFIDQVDLERNVVVVTGDHGEMFGEDGRFGHSHSLSDHAVRTPLFIIGADVPRRTVAAPTTHADLLPTLEHLFTGQEPAAERWYGRSMLSDNPRGESLVVASNEAFVVVHEGRRLRFEVDWDEGFVTLAGFEDANGQIITQPVEVDDPQMWIDLATDELRRLRR